MGFVSRIYNFVNGTSADADQVDAEFDNIIATLNGNIDNANISGSASIAATKVDPIPPARVLDHADTEAEYKTTATAGDTSAPDLPTTLEGELERLRYRIGANRGYLASTSYMEASTPTSASWTEPAIVGRNLLPNSGFELATSTDAAPPGWTLLGTPDEVDIETPAHSIVGLEKRSLRILTDDSNEGIECEVAGLKANTKYLIGVAYNLAAGTLNLTTTNGLASGGYQNLALSDSSASATAATVEILQGIVQARSTSIPVTVSIFGSATGADFNLIEVWMYELSDWYPHDLPAIPIQSATDSTQDTSVPATFTGSQWNWETWTPLSLSQYIPYAGYRLVYEVTISATSNNTADDNHQHAFRMQLDSGSGAATVQGPFIHVVDANGAANFSVGKTVSMRHIVDNPTPGLTYAFTTDIGAYNGGGDYSQITMNPTVNGLQSVSTARLIVERI